MIKEKEELYELIFNVIENQCDNRNFKEYLRDKFLDKKLSASIPNQILGQSLPLTDCDDIELICFAEACKEFFLESEAWQQYDKKEYFGEDTLSDYELYNPVELNPKVIILKNVTVDPDNENNFLASFVPVEQIVDWEKYRMSRYNFDTQRQGTPKKLRNGKKIKQRTINKTSVEQISNLFYKNKFKINTITFNILAIKGKKPKIDYNDETHELKIEPNYDVDDVNFTPFDLIDGQHRVSGASRYVNRCRKERIPPKGRLHVSIMTFTKEEARNYIEIQARQNLLSPEYQESLKTNEHTKFIDMMANYSTKNKNIFVQNISEMYDDISKDNTLTYRTLLVNAIKLTKINVNDNIEKKFASEKFAEIITTLINFMKKEFYNDNLYDMKKENIFLTPNIFIGYIAIAEYLWEDKDYISSIIDIATMLQEKEVKRRLETFKLNNKNINEKSIFNYFKSLLKILDEVKK